MNGVQSYTIDRGRAYELDKTDVGTAQIQIIDTDGDWDPTNSGSAFLALDATALDPLKPAAIALYNPFAEEWKTIYRGFVEDYNFTVDLSEKFLTVELNLVDGLDVLAAAEISPASGTGDFTLTAQQVDDRINDALTLAGWPSGALRNIFSGNVNVKDTVYPPRTQALSIIQDAADAEFPGVANFFMSKEGVATFHGRVARFDPSNATYGLSQWKAGDLAAVAGDATLATIFGFEFTRRKTDIINSGLATPQDISDADLAGQLVEDATSIGIYGTRSWSAENLITDQGLESGTPNDLDETEKFATYYTDNYASPRSRINQVTFKGLPPTAAGAEKTWQLICGVDISDTVDITTTHPGGGGFNETFFVEGIHYEVRPLNATYMDVTLTLDVSPAAYFTSDPFS